MTDSVEIPTWALSVGIWAAGLGAVLAALVKLVPRVRELYLGLRESVFSVDDEVRARQELRASLLNIRRVVAIEGLCKQWVTRKGAQRCLGLIANNGGDAWKGIGPLVVNNPAQAIGPGNRDTREEWRDWNADAWYIGFLGRLLETLEHKRCYLLVADQDVEGELKNAYRQQGTVASIVIPFVWKSGSQLWYISINFGRPLADGEEEMPDEEKQSYIALARQIYANTGLCRALVDTARGVYNSVR